MWLTKYIPGPLSPTLQGEKPLKTLLKVHGDLRGENNRGESYRERKQKHLFYMIVMQKIYTCLSLLST